MRKACRLDLDAETKKDPNSSAVNEYKQELDVFDRELIRRGLRKQKEFVMDDATVEKMVLELIEQVDYDIYKSFLPDCSEDPDEIPERMAELVEIVRKYIPKETSKPRKSSKKK